MRLKCKQEKTIKVNKHHSVSSSAKRPRKMVSKNCTCVFGKYFEVTLKNSAIRIKICCMEMQDLSKNMHLSTTRIVRGSIASQFQNLELKCLRVFTIKS